MKEKIKNWFNRPKVHSKRSSLIAAIIIVLGGFSVWVFFTHSGDIFRQDISRQMTPVAEQRDIDVYCNGQLIEELSGMYAIESQKDRTVIYNTDTHERIDFYGDVVIIDKVDESYKD